MKSSVFEFYVDVQLTVDMQPVVGTRAHDIDTRGEALIDSADAANVAV